MVECTALEMRHTGNRIGGSNPSLSAICYCNFWIFTNNGKAVHCCIHVCVSTQEWLTCDNTATPLLRRFMRRTTSFWSSRHDLTALD